MTWRPDLTVAAIVYQEDRFLMVEERIAGRLVLNQPAGHVEDDESILDAVVRETLEETAWRFEPEHLVGTYLWKSPTSGRSTLRFAIAGRAVEHLPERRLDHGIIAARWLSRDALVAQLGKLRSPLVLRCCDDFLAGQRFDLAAMAHVLPGAEGGPMTGPAEAIGSGAG